MIYNHYGGYIKKSILLKMSLQFKKALTIREVWYLFERFPERIINQDIQLRGRIFTERGNKELRFIELLDGSTVRTIQCVCDSKTNQDLDWETLFSHASRGATVKLKGTLIKSPAKGQPIELSVKDFECWGKVDDSYQLASKGKITRDFLRTIPHIRHHTLIFTAIQCIKQSVYKGFHDSMKEMGIGEIQPTLITSNECESGAFPFTVTTLLKDDPNLPTVKDGKQIDFSKDFFGKRVFLTVSSQLHLEATVCGTGRDGYVMTTAFRAEPSKGPLHLAEFLMPEWELVDSGLEGNMAVAQQSIQHCLQKVLRECKPELQYLEKYRLKELDDNKTKALADHKIKKKDMNKKEWVNAKKMIEKSFEDKKNRLPLVERLQRYVDNQFVVSSHEECVRLMLKDVEEGKVQFTETPGYDQDLSKEHERYITEVIYDGLPVFVRYFPKEIKAFYMPVIDKGAEIEHVDCYDLLFPYVGEVVGGSQRVHDYDHLKERMEEIGMNIEPLQWYLDLRRYGSIPHGGAGIGFGRLLLVITDIFNIKDMQEFPRGYGGICHA